MNCETYLNLLEKYEDGTITAEELIAMGRHEENCEECAVARSRVDQLNHALRDLADDVPLMPEGFHNAYMEKIRQEEGKKKHFPIRRILAIAASLIAVIGVINILGGTSQRRRTSSITASYSGEWEGSVYDEDDAYYAVTEEADFAAESVVMASKASVDVNAYGVATGSGINTNDAGIREKKIIRSASLTIATTSFDESVEALRQKCEDLGGWVGSASVSESKSGLQSGYFTLQIPQENLDTFLEGSTDIGRVTSRNESSIDVTESYYDTRTRLETQKMLLERLQSLIGTAAELEDLLKLESQIADTQYMIDSLTQDLNRTDRSVAYSTVSVELKEEKKKEVVETRTISYGERVIAAFKLGISDFIDFLQDVFLNLISNLIPLIITIFAGIFLYRIIKKRILRKRK